MPKLHTYHRYKNALEAIAQCSSIDEVRAIAEEALCPEEGKPRCAQCQHRAATATSDFCSTECRESYAKARPRYSFQPTPRHIQAFEMRESGMTYTEIGRMFDICNVSARRLVTRILEQRRFTEALRATPGDPAQPCYARGMTETANGASEPAERDCNFNEHGRFLPGNTVGKLGGRPRRTPPWPRRGYRARRRSSHLRSSSLDRGERPHAVSNAPWPSHV
jgi:hypothetical protein